MKKIILFLFLIIITFTSCTADLYQHLIIKGFGIDKIGDEYKVSVRYAKIEEDEGEDVFFVKGESVYDALNKISIQTGKKPLYSSASYIICSEKVASEGLDKSLDFFVRYFKAKPVIRLLISEGTAEEIMSAKKDDKLIPSEIITDSTENTENQGKTVSATVMSFISDSKSESKASVLPLIKLENDEYNANKSAMFSNYKLIDFLDEKETKSYLVLSGNLANSSMVIEDENNDKITIEIGKTSAKMKNLENFNFEINLEITTSLTAIPFESASQNYDNLENKISEKIKENTENLLKKISKTSCDILGFSNFLYKNNNEFWKNHSNEFLNYLDESEIAIKVKTNFTKTGEEDRGGARN